MGKNYTFSSSSYKKYDMGKEKYVKTLNSTETAFAHKTRDALSLCPSSLSWTWQLVTH